MNRLVLAGAFFFVLCFVSGRALANGHSSGGGGGSSSDPDADCIEWKPVAALVEAEVDLGAADAGSDGGQDDDGGMSVADGGGAVDAGRAMDAGAALGGSKLRPGFVCVKHALLFGCAVGPGGGSPKTGLMPWALLAGALVLFRSRRS